MSLSRPLKATLGSLAIVALATAAAAAEPHVQPMERLAMDTVSKWITDPRLIEVVNAQNAAHADLTQDQIDQMDKQWRAEVGASARPLIDELLSRDASRFLADTKNSTQGLVTEVFVMDNKGLNVAQSDVTSDYWQGDEAKWQKTYLAGPGALFIDGIEQDESTQTFQSQLSMSIVDPASGQVIGAITVGVDVDRLLQ